jgi:5'-methylthioinosine phosphorylase
VKPLAIIGGTGVEQIEGLERLHSHRVETPFGAPSGAIVEGRLGAARVFFLHRHGSPRAIPPHLINYRANLWALHSLGVAETVAINAVGGIATAMRPGRLVIPDQLIDYTWGRAHTFDEGAGGQLMHIDFTEPYTRELRFALVDAATAGRIPHESSGVYGVAQGPRLETAAEVRRMAQDGCDIVGMTAMPEAALARELGLAYAAICMVVNPAAGMDDRPITQAMMRDILQREAGAVREILVRLLAARYGA